VSERENETTTAAEGDEREEYEGWPRAEWAGDADESEAEARSEVAVAEPSEEVAETEEERADEGTAGALGHVVEAEEAGVHTVEHVGGEIDVPPGYALIEGEPRGERRSVGVVVSRFNGGITNRLLQRALDALAEAGVPQEGITIMPVPGAFELPLAAMALAKTRRYACVVALGCVIRGETPHFEFVATEAASGLQLAAIETGVPVAFGVLTCNTVSQAEARIDRAADAVQSALEMADAFSQLRASAKTG
jgi:6,7-dimethyl-8-ribityllumazine synthase